MSNVKVIREFGEAIKKNLQCPICLGTLNQPTSGECLHKFCKLCIEKQIRSTSKPRCPICNKPISRRSLRRSEELKPVIDSAEALIEAINEECVADNDTEPIFLFSQCSTVASDTDKAPKAIPGPSVTGRCMVETPNTNATKRVAKTPACKWQPSETSSSTGSRKRKKTDEPQNRHDLTDTREKLFKALENGSLGENKKRKPKKPQCSKNEISSHSEGQADKSKVIKAQSSPEKDRESPISLKENLLHPEGKENISNSGNKNVNVTESPSSNICDLKLAIAARTRALERLKQQSKELEASGKVAHTSFKSTSYNSPKPTLTVGKKVSPFVLKPVNTPSPKLVAAEKKPLPSAPPPIDSDDDDNSLEIGTKSKKKRPSELNISSSESESEDAPKDNVSSSVRSSLKRNAVKPPVIDEDFHDSYVPNDSCVLSANAIEQNTIDVLETSMGSREPPNILIKNQNRHLRSAKQKDVITIGTKGVETASVNDPSEEKPCSGVSLEIIEDLPAFDIEGGNTPIDSECVDDEGSSNSKDNGTKQLDLETLPKKMLSRSKKLCPQTPKLGLDKNNCIEATTPSQIDVIKSTNTVLETPMLEKKDNLKVLETPIVSDSSLTNASRKRCINFDGSDGETNDKAIEKKMKCENKKSKQSAEKKLSGEQTRTNKSSQKKKRHIDTQDTRSSRAPSNGRKNVVAELVPTDPSAKKTSPKLTIDKVGQQINYTIEKENPTARLTIIQEGEIISPKLMKHICSDVLQSDPNSCADLVNSLLDDSHPGEEENSKSLDVDHTALIFGSDANNQEPATGNHMPSGKSACAEPDSLEGYTYQQSDFNEIEFKKTFGISAKSPRSAKENSTQVEQNVIQDSQPDCYEPKTNLSSPRKVDPTESRNKNGGGEGHGVVPGVVPDFVAPLVPENPSSTSTQLSKNSSSPTTPSKSVSSMTYTTQDIALIQRQIRENELELLRLQQVEEADNFTQDELFDDIASDVTLCEEKPMIANAKKIPLNDHEPKNCPESENRSSQRDSPLKTNESQVDVGDIPPPPPLNPGESEVYAVDTLPDDSDSVGKDVIAETLNEVVQDSLHGELKLEQMNEDPDGMADGMVDGTTDGMVDGMADGMSEGMSDGRLCGGTPEKEMKEGEELTEDHHTKRRSSYGVADAGEVKHDASVAVKAGVSGDIQPGAKVEKTEPKPLPMPNIGSNSVHSEDLIPTQAAEQSPVVVCKTPIVRPAVQPTQKIIYVLLSGSMGKGRSRYALKLQYCLRDRCGVRFKLLTQWSDRVTHLVFPHNEEMLCPQTIKYLQGLAAGKWIVSNDWLKECVERKELTNEAPFEMQGSVDHGRTGSPRAARLAKTLNQPPLFANLVVYLVGDIQLIPKPVFCQLLEAMGANIVPEPGSSSTQTQLTYKSQSRVYPLIDSDVHDINEVAAKYGERPLTAQWVVNCLTLYRYLGPDT